LTKKNYTGAFSLIYMFFITLLYNSSAIIYRSIYLTKRIAHVINRL